jgi:AraC-like DNA-binding protein
VDRGECPLADGSILFGRSGSFWLQNAHERFLLDANYVAFCVEGDVVVPCTSGTRCECTVLQFAGHSFYGASLYDRCKLSSPETHLQQARVIKRARLGAGVSQASAVSVLVRCLSDAADTASIAERQSDVVQSVRALLNHSLSARPSLHELAERFYLSPYTVSRVFHRQTGLPLRSYVQRLRLRHALNAMIGSQSALSGIAVDHGFYDEPHFSRAFRAEFGRPPARILETL